MTKRKRPQIASDSSPAELLPARKESRGEHIRIAPLPHPDEMVVYREKTPETYDAILESFKKEGEARRAREWWKVIGTIFVTVMSQIIVWSLVLLLAVSGFLLVWYDKPTQGWVLILAALAPIIIAQIKAGLSNKAK